MNKISLNQSTIAKVARYLVVSSVLSVCATASADNAAGMKYYNAKQYQQAYKEFYADATKGNAVSAFNLGYMYQQGLGVKTDYLQSAKWFKISADRGYVDAMMQLGLMYRDDGFKLSDRGYGSAFSWYMKAAVQGNSSGQYEVGNFYQLGLGVGPDIHQAINWYRMAADQGNKEAQYALGMLYEYSDSVKKDYPQAASFYRKAALQGYAKAQSGLGMMYEKGKGVPKNLKLALQWCQKAADAQDDDGIDCVARLK